MGKRLSNMSDFQLLMVLAVVRLFIHVLANGQYGFHRDALAFLDNGQHLDWGFIAYPPFTPFIGRIGMELFGLSLVGIKSLAALAQCAAMVLAGLMAKELGGKRPAVVVTALAVAVAPISLLMSTLFQYIGFDFLWWVLTAYCMLRLLKSENPRWWLGIGTAIGLGMMTKYTILFLVAGVVVATMISPLRRHLRSGWLWAGVGLSLLIFLPNLVWQIQHDFISIEFLRAISERDVAIGRTEGYFWQQLVVNANPLLIFLWVMGLYYYLFGEGGGRFRPMAVLYLVPLVSFWLMNGRFYYIAAAYPMLVAAGSVAGEGWLERLSERRRSLAFGIFIFLFVAGTALAAVLMMPIYPVNSGLWDFSAGVHDNFSEQIGWQEIAENVAGIYEASLNRYPSLGILAGNYGEAAAINLYGRELGLPPVISPVNSYWLRSLPDRPPEAVIVLGYELPELLSFFGDCEVVGQNGNSLGVENEESRFHPDIYLCQDPQVSWETIWPEARRFG